ncbi:hypothetical protein L211DRAFT_839768 [Terfezia boudieri ATCC MYA-4762]|uniref:Uncharacterized protein n=1 Tax=Terfezia boudieri ATCC MYA-4762 TaxID=1051890 RepID=A0A3N4LM36_9PEZI|nr:hypothetical protein L211DRAFT_839768 [Terfezia boudieri ATCC MYA-4762]
MRDSVQNIAQRSSFTTYSGNPVQILFIVIGLFFVFLIITFGPPFFDFIQERRAQRKVLRANADEEANITQQKQDLIRKQKLAYEFEESTGVVEGLWGKKERDRGGVYLMLDTRQAELFKGLDMAESEMDDIEEVKLPQKVRFKR